eukprot:172378-Chlamydomonas_euryale.AAC.3
MTLPALLWGMTLPALLWRMTLPALLWPGSSRAPALLWPCSGSSGGLATGCAIVVLGGTTSSSAWGVGPTAFAEPAVPPRRAAGRCRPQGRTDPRARGGGVRVPRIHWAPPQRAVFRARA